MGILLAPYPARGHVSPFLAVAAELARRGAAVRMVVGAEYAGAVRAAGVVPVVAGAARGARVAPGWRPADLADRYRSAAERRGTAEEFRLAWERELVADPPALVVLDPHARWLRSLRSRLRVAWLWTTSPRFLGAEPVLVNGLAELSPGARRNAGPVRFLGPLLGGLQEAAPAFLRERPSQKLVVVSYGTVFARRAVDLRAVARSFHDSDWMVVLATGGVPVEALGRLPGNVFAASSIPQAGLVRHADVLVTHGGMNSVLEAASAGVPMLLAPRSREQRGTAARLTELGVAGPAGRARELRERVEQLAGSSRVSAGVVRLRELVRSAPGAVAAADQLLDLRAALRMC
jgi:UDP:flavonoid glycosyltransferase YjiC (YdhE family)